MYCNRSFPYVQISKFGSTLNPILTVDPLGSSIYKDVDSNFDVGDSSGLYGPKHENSQLYMAERCSKEWDGACEFLSRDSTDTTSNSGKISSPLFPTVFKPGKESVGDFLVENASVRRFCDLSSCAISQTPYNYHDSNSVYVKSYGCRGTDACMPICMPPDNPDQDILMNKVLDKPDLNIDLLLNMYRNVIQKNLRDKYKNNRIGQIFNIFDLYIKMGKL